VVIVSLLFKDCCDDADVANMFIKQFSAVFYDSYADIQPTYSPYMPYNDMLESCMLKETVLLMLLLRPLIMPYVALCMARHAAQMILVLSAYRTYTHLLSFI